MQIPDTIAAISGVLAWGKSVEQDQDKPLTNDI
jgi:hypothetical protein